MLCRCSACVFIVKTVCFEVGCTRKFATKSTEGPRVSTTHENVAEVNSYSAFFFVCRKNVFEFSSIFVGNTYEMGFQLTTPSVLTVRFKKEVESSVSEFGHF